MARPIAAWTCASVEPKDPQGLGAVKIMVVITPNCHHNKVTEITPDVVFIDVGAAKKQGRANVELLGFLAFLFDLSEDQVRLETTGAGERNKLITLSGLKHSKHEVIWLLENQVGKRHEAHFSQDNVNAARNASSKSGIKRKQELNEFQNLREEAYCAAVTAAATAASTLPARRPLPSSVHVKRKALDLSEETAKEASKSVTESVAVFEAPSVPSNKESSVQKDAAAAEAGIGGLAAYDSDEDSEDEDEAAPLPKPVL